MGKLATQNQRLEDAIKEAQIYQMVCCLRILLLSADIDRFPSAGCCDEALSRQADKSEEGNGKHKRTLI